MLVAGLVAGLRGSIARDQFILFQNNAPARTPDLSEAKFLDQPTQNMKMKSLIGMEMLLLGASILIFRSVWNFLDTLAWASGTIGLAVLLVVGLVAAVVALRGIEALSEAPGRKAKEE